MNEAYEVYRWLAHRLRGERNILRETLKNEKAVQYLLIWPIFEQKCFEGFMQKGKIPDFARKYQAIYAELNCDGYANYFHSRYQDKKLLRNLLYSGKFEDKFTEFENAISDSYSNLTDQQKLMILLYVSYRYRNNIFHGNKGIESWARYETQIEKCLHFMMSLIDCMELHGDKAA